eukprot:ANDGO_07716.mRNA.1 hypothetical protein
MDQKQKQQGRQEREQEQRIKDGEASARKDAHVEKRFEDVDSDDEQSERGEATSLSPFSPAEHERFLDAMYLHGPIDMYRISVHVATRSLSECIEYWHKLSAVRPMIDPRRPNKMLSMAELVDIARKILKHGLQWKQIAIELSKEWNRPVLYYHVRYGWRFMKARRSELANYLYNVIQYLPMDIADRILSNKSNFFGINDDVCNHPVFRDFKDDLLDYQARYMRLEAFSCRTVGENYMNRDRALTNAPSSYAELENGMDAEGNDGNTADIHYALPILNSQKESALYESAFADAHFLSASQDADYGRDGELRKNTIIQRQEKLVEDLFAKHLLLAEEKQIRATQLPTMLTDDDGAGGRGGRNDDDDDGDTSDAEVPIPLESPDRFKIMPIEAEPVDSTASLISSSWLFDDHSSPVYMGGAGLLDGQTEAVPSLVSSILDDPGFDEMIVRKTDSQILFPQFPVFRPSVGELLDAVEILNQIKSGEPVATLGRIPRIFSTSGDFHFPDPLDGKPVKARRSRTLYYPSAPF